MTERQRNACFALTLATLLGLFLLQPLLAATAPDTPQGAALVSAWLPK